jgi:phospholipid N-methyltransferase
VRSVGISTEDRYRWLADPSSAPAKYRDYFPQWAPEAVRRDSTGDMPFDKSFAEARLFYEMLRGKYSEVCNRELISVLDYGCGWGRITRFFVGDVSAENLWACDPNREFTQIFRECGIRANLVDTDWMSAQRFIQRQFDLVFSFSILTHSSEILTRNIFERFDELVAPGGLLVFTIRPEEFLTIEYDGGDRKAFGADNIPAAIADYKNGKFVYRPYDDVSPQWGVTVIPLPWLMQNMPTRFEYIGQVPDKFSAQLPVIFKAKQ